MTSKRQEVRAERRRDFYLDKLDDSATAEQIAKTYYQVLCGYIRNMPEAERDQAWQQAVRALGPLVRSVTDGAVRIRSSQRRAANSGTYAHSRARARARETS